MAPNPDLPPLVQPLLAGLNAPLQMTLTAKALNAPQGPSRTGGQGGGSGNINQPCMWGKAVWKHWAATVEYYDVRKGAWRKMPHGVAHVLKVAAPTPQPNPNTTQAQLKARLWLAGKWKIRALASVSYSDGCGATQSATGKMEVTVDVVSVSFSPPVVVAAVGSAHVLTAKLVPAAVAAGRLKSHQLWLEPMALSMLWAAGPVILPKKW